MLDDPSMGADTRADTVRTSSCLELRRLTVGEYYARCATSLVELHQKAQVWLKVSNTVVLGLSSPFDQPVLISC